MRKSSRITTGKPGFPRGSKQSLSVAIEEHGRLKLSLRGLREKAVLIAAQGVGEVEQVPDTGVHLSRGRRPADVDQVRHGAVRIVTHGHLVRHFRRVEASVRHT